MLRSSPVRFAAAAACAVLLVAIASPVIAPAVAGVWGDRTVGSGTDDDGAWARVVDRSVDDAALRSGGTPACRLRFERADRDLSFLVEFNGDGALLIGRPAPTEAHRAFLVFCDDLFLTAVWAIPIEAVASIAEAATRDLLARLPFPALAIGASPRVGLTGLESWFWIEGSTGGPVSSTTAAYGIRIDLEVGIADVVWSFGDSAGSATGFGQRPPVRSDVAHTYERKGPVRVVATFRHTARYRVDGEAWVALPAVGRSVVLDYPIIEIRSLLSR